MSSSQKLSQQQCLAVAKGMFNNRPRGDAGPAKKKFAGKVVKVGVPGQLDRWMKEKGFGFIKTPDMDVTQMFPADVDARFGDVAQVFCHSRQFSEACQVNTFVKFDLWENAHTRKIEAINITQSRVDFIEVAKDQFGTMEQRYELIRGDNGKPFRCAWDDFDQESSFRRFDFVRFDSIWKGHGQFKAMNIRLGWSGVCVEDKALVVDDSACASTDAGSEATAEFVNPEVRKLQKKLREIDALVGRQDLELNQQAKVEKREEFQKRLNHLMALHESYSLDALD